MRRFLTLLVTLVVFGVGSALGQTKQITGKVISSEDNQPIPGANVFVKSSKNIGTMTDANGSFTLKNIPTNAKTIVIRFVGYQELELPISSSFDNVALIPETQKIDEVVVVGYGSAKKVGTVVGSVASVKSDKIKEKPTANPIDALQGKVAGLQVYTSSGEPSAISSIRLHGVGSLGASSTPLYVLDGIPIDEKAMITLNPNDFESINVLKDASATSIYGSRAANGVIFITTKRGKLETKAKVTVNAQTGFSEFANTDYFDRFMNTKQLTDFWAETGYMTRDEVDALIKKYPNDTKWYKYYYKNKAKTYNGDISISGGAGKTNYYISSSYFFQDGLATHSEYEKYTFRSNISTKANDWLSFGVNLSGGSDTRQTNPYGENSTNRGLAMLAQPFFTPYDKDGKKYPDMIPGWNRYNPEYLAEKNPSEANNIQFNGSGFIQINPIKGLIIKSQGGIDAFDYTSYARRLPSHKANPNDGTSKETYQRYVTKTITNTIEYKLNFLEKNQLTTLIGHEGVSNVSKGFDGSSSGHTDDRLMLLQHGPNNKVVNSFKTEYAYLSYFGRLDYNYSEKYFADFSVRRDGSSRFGTDKRYANFWAVGAMWNAKKESFLQDIDLLSSLNIKFSYGTSGNSDIGNYDNLALVGATQYNSSTGWNISTPGNPKLGWEEQTKATLGVKFSLYDDRYRFNIEAYSRKTTNMLIETPYPYTSGFGSILSNVGELKNTGIDFEFNFDILRGKDYFVSPYVNFNYNKNEVTELFQGLDVWIIPNTGVCWAVGKPVSYFYPVFAGIDKEDGAPMWYKPGTDITKKSTKETTKEFKPTLEQNTGIKRYAPFTGGFGLNAGWKGINLSADFSFAQGKYLINNDKYFFENPFVFGGFNQQNTVLDYWKKPGDVTKFPSTDYQFMQFDSRMLENASFIRLKSLSIAYTFTDKVLSHTKFFTSARIFLTGRNLLTFTNYSGPDPEIDSNLTLGANPNTRQYSLGIMLSF